MTKFSGSFSEFVHSWRYFIWILVLGLAIALFYLEEDWRGHWSWQRYQRRMQLQGEHLDYSAFVPPRVPDNENFTMTPFLERLFDFIPGTQKWAGANPLQSVGAFAPKYDSAARELAKAKTVRFSSWIKPQTDLWAWHQAFLKANTNSVPQESLQRIRLTRPEAAKAVLDELSECQAVLEEIQVASRLPYSRFNLRYEEDNPAGILLPHLATVKHLCQVLSLRASASLGLGENERAFNDVKLMLFLTETSKNEPFLISQLVRMAELYIVLQPLAEGLEHWSDPQLRELQQKLAQYDMLADAKRNLAAERAWGCAIISYVARASEKNLLGNITGQPEADVAGVLMSGAPGGWLDLEQLHYCRTFQESVLPAIDLSNRQVNPGVAGAKAKHIALLNGSSWPGAYLHHRLFSKLLLPAIDKFVRKAAFGQTAVDTSMLACALERYRKVHGRFPEALDVLTPQFVPTLPHDIISGQSLKYRLMDGQHYLLYSVGWNQIDDGGQVAASDSGEGAAAEEGDWVWRLPDAAADH